MSEPFYERVERIIREHKVSDDRARFMAAAEVANEKREQDSVAAANFQPSRGYQTRLGTYQDPEPERKESTAEEMARHQELVARSKKQREDAEQRQKENAERVRQEALKRDEEAIARRVAAADPKFIERERARNSDPNREITCPACKHTVQLVNGKLPQSHTIRELQGSYFEDRICTPLGHETPKTLMPFVI